MVHDKVIKGKYVDLRSITLEDAEFSYSIRADEKYRDIVGQPAADVESQKRFIEWQMKEPGDYYFVALNKKGKRIGLIGVYNIQGDTAEVGREVSYGNPLETMETSMLITDFCKNVLGLKKTYFVIYLNNKRQLSMQKKLGRKPLRFEKRNGVDCAYFETSLDDTSHNKVRELFEIIG